MLVNLHIASYVEIATGIKGGRSPENMPSYVNCTVYNCEERKQYFFYDPYFRPNPTSPLANNVVFMVQKTKCILTISHSSIFHSQDTSVWSLY